MEVERNLSGFSSPPQKRREPGEKYENYRYMKVSDLYRYEIRQEISNLYLRNVRSALMSLLADVAISTCFIIKIDFSRYSADTFSL
jgi:hypothetical protein